MWTRLMAASGPVWRAKWDAAGTLIWQTRRSVSWGTHVRRSAVRTARNVDMDRLSVLELKVSNTLCQCMLDVVGISIPCNVFIGRF